MRHGQHPVSIVLGFIIVVLTIVVAFLVFKVLREANNTIDEDATCAAQIATHSAIVTATKETVAPAISCPTKLVQIATTDEEDVKAEIARQMVRCWNTWGQGKQRLFGEKELIYCHVCSMITVTGTSNIKGFPKYLDTTIAKGDMTYSALLQGKKSGTYFDDTAYQATASKEYPVDKPIGVIFYYAKGLHWYETLRNTLIGNSGASTVGGLVAAGGVWSATGVGATIGVPLLALGAAGGFATSIWGKADSSYMAMVVVRPLVQGDIQALGCEYAPANN